MSTQGRTDPAGATARTSLEAGAWRTVQSSSWSTVRACLGSCHIRVLLQSCPPKARPWPRALPLLSDRLARPALPTVLRSPNSGEVLALPASGLAQSWGQWGSTGGLPTLGCRRRVARGSWAGVARPFGLRPVPCAVLCSPALSLLRLWACGSGCTKSHPLGVRRGGLAVAVPGREVALMSAGQLIGAELAELAEQWAGLLASAAKV